MDRKNKACWNCANFGAYYKRGFCQFNKTNKGTCSVKKEIIDRNGFCERWRNTFNLRSSRKERTLKALSEILEHIAAIRQILEEENEESKIHPDHIDL
ncbi:MAG: hypothetical protein J6K86_00695 [Clostridia bacterium]|nr:hypothetical protein [Clostridia bacterium]